MNNFDFASWYVLLAIFIAHYYRITQALDNLPKQKKELIMAFEGLKDGNTNNEGMNIVLRNTKKILWNIDTGILHVLAISIIIACILIIFNIPNKVLTPSEYGPLAELMTSGERIIYVLISLLFATSYVSKALIPSIQIVMQISKIRKSKNGE